MTGTADGPKLAPEDLDRFLSWLEGDPDRRPQRYLEIQRGLVRFFANHGCEVAEELADESLNRVTAKLHAIVDGYVGAPAAYIYGVARNVLHEHRRSRRTRAQRLRAYVPSQVDSSYEERRHACLERCLQQAVSPDERELIRQYYQLEGTVQRRRFLAAEAQVSSTTLRKRTERLRQRLRRCIESCLGSVPRGPE
jgi:RNA polymerase sigma factor (sigma-70 family)